MRYWLCCDGGGTKLQLLLIDEELSILRSARVGGVNPIFLPEAIVRRNMLKGVRAVTSGVDFAIEACYAALTAPIDWLEGALSAAGVQTRAIAVSEGAMGLMAGVCRERGFVALSGTGSNAFYVSDEGMQRVGGWGILLGDEGSGAYIGQRGLMAAIYAMDGRGEPTRLTDELLDWLGKRVAEAGSAFEALVQRVYQAPSPRAALADFAPCVTRACERGDPIAAGIIEQAGAEMGRHMIALLNRVTAEDPGASLLPSTLCGSAWKGDGRMYQAYRDSVLSAYPGFEIQWPLFDAVAGGAVRVGLSLGYTPGEIQAQMKKTFRKHLYQASEICDN